MPHQPVPSWIDKVNFVKFYVSNPCNFPWVVYFETALPAAGNLLIALFSFDTGDILRSLFRPKGLRSGRHGRKGRRGKRPRALIPEPSDVIADHVPGQEARATRRVSDGVRHLWAIDNRLQQALNIWQVVDLVTNFAYDWQSAIVRDPRTHCANIGRMLRTQEFYTVLGGGWGAITANHVEYQENLPGGSAGEVTVGPGNWTISIAGTIHDATPFHSGVTAGLGLSITAADFTSVGSSGARRVQWPGTSDAVATAAIKGPATVYLRALAIDGPIEVTGFHFFVMQCDDQ